MAMPGPRRPKRKTGRIAPGRADNEGAFTQIRTGGVPGLNVHELAKLVAELPAESLTGWYTLAGERLSQIGVKPKRNAAMELPKATGVEPTMNGASIVSWLKTTEDVQTLRAVHATLRRKIRQG